MPNTGKPSLACHECRRRRVKCDLRRPGCLRCSKYDLVCPGYRDETDLRFRHSNTDTIKLKTTGAGSTRKRRAGPTKSDADADADTSAETSKSDLSSASSSSSSSDSDSDAPRTAIVTTSTRVLHGLSQDWRSHSHRVVIECYPWVSALEPLMNSVRQNSPLSLSTAMLARGYLVNRRMLAPSAGEEAYVRGMCLEAVRNAISQPKLAVKDSTILAVWMMGSYEVLQGSITWPPRRENSWRIHQIGLLSLLAARGTDQFKTLQGRVIFWLCVETVQIHYNAMNQPCPAELLAWLHRMKRWKLSPAETMNLASAFTSARASDLYPQMLEVLFSDNPGFAAAAIPALVAEVEAIDADYAHWEQLAADPKHPELQRQARGQYKLPVSRLKMHHFLVYALNLAEQAGDDEMPAGLSGKWLRQRRHRETLVVQEIAEKILATGPPAEVMSSAAPVVGSAWSKNMAMMYPFASIRYMQTPRVEQRVRAREVLYFIGRKCGILQALRPSMGTPMPEMARRGMPEVDVPLEGWDAA